MVNRQKIDNYTARIADSLGAQLKARRIALNMLPHELSAKSSVSIRWISEIENGYKIPSIYILASISMALDFYEWEFFTLKNF